MANFFSKWWLFVTTATTLLFGKGQAGCYFPLEFQGEFLTQSMVTREIAYSSVSILFDSIPSWGQCHRRLGKHIILSNGGGGDESSSSPCFKCLSMVARSANVLQLHANEVGRCHLSEESAIQSCPTQRDVRERKASEMMLYKTKSFYGGSAITRTYCPLNGNYKFTYSINDGTEDDLECNEAVSHAGDCPTGYKFDLHFKGCSFPDFDMSFQCLGSWPGENGETYMSLLDTKLPQLGEDPRPRYRCALFKEDPDTGLTHMAFSSDSTCYRHLYSAQDGFETLHLEKLQPYTGSQVAGRMEGEGEAAAVSSCVFPDWLQGEWEGLTIEGSEFTYRDEHNFVTYRGSCMDFVNGDDFASSSSSEAGQDGQSDLKFLLQLQTECGSSSYNCAQFQRRDSNVMEFQLGISSTSRGGGERGSSNTERLSNKLCSSENFTPSKWLTLGRTSAEEPPHCPLVGEYTGVIPDADSLCAKSYADCNNPEVMFYTVFNCNNASEVYEEREYRCFGQWKEPETGLVYTYTERRDIRGHECFVGVDIDEDRSIVTEAGANCERGHQPRKYGMTLERQAKCPAAATVASSAADTNGDEAAFQGSIYDGDVTVNVQRRPVSPKLSNVQRVVIGDSELGLPDVLDEIEREQEERYYEREVPHNKRRNPSDDYRDILSNEIPDSYPRSSADSSCWINARLIAAAAAVVICTTFNARHFLPRA